MSKLQVSDMLARAFAAEGVEVLFTLMGDANMYWSVAMSKLPGMKVIHGRHEHCAVAMADGYARATRQGRRRLDDLRTGFHPDHDGAHHRRARQRSAGRVRGRFTDRRLVVPAADRHGAADAGLRCALRRRETYRPPARQCARGLPGGAGPSSGRSCSPCPWTCRSRPGRTSPTTRPPANWCRWRSDRFPIPSSSIA